MSLMVLLVLKLIPYNSPSEVILLYYDYPHLQRRKLRPWITCSKSHSPAGNLVLCRTSCTPAWETAPAKKHARH